MSDPNRPYDPTNYYPQEATVLQPKEGGPYAMRWRAIL